jgi:cytochrome c oxidase cbb3-type subunit 3
LYRLVETFATLQSFASNKVAREVSVRRAALLLLCAIGGCQRETRETNDAPIPIQQGQLATTTTVMAGGTRTGPPDPRIAHYEKNAWHVSEGQRLYQQFNCVECHAHGGGGIGPALIDEEWTYGSSSPQIVATLIQGRPNGMPSFRNVLTEQQMWQIAAYVRGMSGQLAKDVPPSRGDHLAATPPATLEKKPPVRNSTDGTQPQ